MDALGDPPGHLQGLLPQVYDELRRLARYHRRAWRDPRTPSTNSVVHETYLRLKDHAADCRSRGQFFALASRVMRSVLVDAVRRRHRKKRCADGGEVALEAAAPASEPRGEDVLALDEALSELWRTDPGLAQVVECRFFGGLTVEETAEAVGLSTATVKRRWEAARARLQRHLRPAEPERPRPALPKALAP